MEKSPTFHLLFVMEGSEPGWIGTEFESPEQAYALADYFQDVWWKAPSSKYWVQSDYRFN